MTLKNAKNTKNAVFYLKVVNKIYSQDVFEEYINFQNKILLNRCGVIPSQSFGSHVRPQLPRLGLNKVILSDSRNKNG
jgi:hypothetical protein